MRPIRPKDAATLLVLRRDPDGLRVLMGRRSDAHVFMPGSVVFPGGRVDRADRHGPACDELHPAVAEKLSIRTRQPAPARQRAIALAAIRETFEEAGVLIGRKGDGTVRARSPAWAAFLQAGIVPTLAPLRLVARAITPPGHNRRFDARFFAVSDEAIGRQVEAAPTELEGPAWLTLGEARQHAIPEITRMVLDTIEERMRNDPDLEPSRPIPFFFVRRGKRCVELL